MKIRTGFVSNSSSSSFILVVDKHWQTIEDVHPCILNEEDDKYDEDTEPTEPYEEDEWSEPLTHAARCQKVFGGSEPAMFEDFAHALTGETCWDIRDSTGKRMHYDEPGYEEQENKLREKTELITQGKIFEFLERHKSKDFMMVNSINDSSDCDLERGDLWTVPFIRISEH